MRNLSQQSISTQMIFLRIAVRLLTIAVHKEMILEPHLFLIQQQLSAINQQLISNSTFGSYFKPQSLRDIEHLY